MSSPSASASLRLLLIEDDPDERRAWREKLRSLPEPRLRLEQEAETLEDGLAALETRFISLVLLDLSLPDASGLEALQRLRAVAPHLPVIVLVEAEEDELTTEAIQFGAQDFLVKEQSDTPALRRALRHAIERARAEAELAQERDSLQTLLENIPDRVYFKDRQSRFTRINHAQTYLLGLQQPEEAYGKTDADFFDSEHAREALADEQQVMESGEPILNKVEGEELKDGRHSWSLTSKLPLRDRSGRIIGTCGISREITAMKELERQLTSERYVLRSVIDNVPDFIYLKDSEGRYLLANASHLKWHGAESILSLIGRSVFDFYPEEIAQRLHADDISVLRTAQPLMNREEQILDRSGELRWVTTTKVPWKDENGVVRGLVCISRDITSQKRAEAGLLQANQDLAKSREEAVAAVRKLQMAHQELRNVQLQLIEAEKMKSVGRLAAGVAHEVKNPLGILKMGVEYLNSTPMQDENAPTILHEMTEAVNRADGVIRGLLDFSAPRRLELQPANLNEIFEGALKMVKGELKGSYQVELELQENLPEVPLDSAKISQVCINLMTNALHAMNGRGTLCLRTYSKQLTGVGGNIGDRRSESFRVGQRIVVAEVDDDGPGIPDDKLGKVFEPFYTTKPTGVGTGLGLSVVKTIIDLHGGTIDLSNRPSGGVRVTMMFQAAA